MTKPNQPIRAVVVDDSPTVRNLLTSILSEAGISVLATGRNGLEALQLVHKHKPDVLTMDIHMPQMDGLEATRHIMREQPTPIVIITGSKNPQDVDLTFQAMRAGALAVVNKPGLADPQTCEKVVQTVQNMSKVHVIHHWGTVQKPVEQGKKERAPSKLVNVSRSLDVQVVGVASSTGGPSALVAVFRALPANYPLPILGVQHVSPGFTAGLVEWLDSQVKLRVEIASHGQKLQPGSIYFAPDDYHIQVNGRGEVELSRSPAYNGLRPSANPLFESLAQHYGKKAVGIILTGMGDDGAKGIEQLHSTGSLTIAQDEKSCVVYGMPREAVLRNAIEKQMNLEEISAFLQELGKLIKVKNGAI